MAKLTSAQFGGKCAACGGRYEKGAPVLYTHSAPRGKKCVHQSCQQQQDQAPRTLSQQETPRPMFTRQAKPQDIYRRFDSVSELVTYASERSPVWANNPVWSDRNKALNSCGVGANWFGVTNPDRQRASALAEAQRIMRDGWQEGVEQIEKAMQGLETPARATSIRRRAIWSNQGDALDIHRVYSGQLDTAWRRTQRQQSVKSAVRTIAFQTTRSAADSPSLWINTGAAVYKLTDLIQQAGYSVRIIAGDSANAITRTNGACFDFGVTVKAPDSPMEPNALAAMVAHPVMCRGAIYAAEARASCEDGKPCEAGLSIGPWGIPQDIAEGAIVVPSFNSLKDARTWVEEQIALINAPDQQAA